MQIASSQPLLSDDLSEWIIQLYRHAQNEKPRAFKRWCFSAIESLLRFDSGLWASRSDLQQMNQEFWAVDGWLYRQPEAFLSNYAVVSSKLGDSDPLNQHLKSHQDQFFAIWDCCPKAQWYKGDFYREHCRHFAIENAISALTTATEASAVRHVFSFYRAEADDEFTPQEIALANALLPHLVEAFRINLLSVFDNSVDKGKTCRAVVDRYGEVMEAESGFIELMQHHQLLSDKKVKLGELSQITAKTDFTLEDLMFQVQLYEGLFFIEVSESAKLTELSVKESEVLALLSKGYTNIGIAQILRQKNNSDTPSHHTVKNHVASILKKLDVEHRVCAAAYYLAHAYDERIA